MTKLETQAHQPSPLTILKNLVGVDGLNLYQTIVDRIEAKDQLKRVYVIGVPGSGKTTIIEGLRMLFKHTGLAVEFKSFDTVRGQFLADKNYDQRPAHSLADLNEDELAEFHIALQYSLSLPAAEPFLATGSNVLTVTEMPAVGKLPRGQSVLKKIAEQRRQQINHALRTPPPPDTLIIHVIADNKVYDFSQRVRRIGQQVENDYDLKVELKKLGLELAPPQADDHHSQQLVQLFRRMATAAQIDTILEEHMQLAHESYENIKTQLTGKNSKEFSALMAFVNQWFEVPAGITIGSEEWKAVTLRVWYAYYMFLHEFNFDRSDLSMLIVAINQFADGGLSYVSKLSTD